MPVLCSKAGDWGHFSHRGCWSLNPFPAQHLFCSQADAALRAGCYLLFLLLVQLTPLAGSGQTPGRMCHRQGHVVIAWLPESLSGKQSGSLHIALLYALLSADRLTSRAPSRQLQGATARPGLAPTDMGPSQDTGCSLHVPSRGVHPVHSQEHWLSRFLKTPQVCKGFYSVSVN